MTSLATLSDSNSLAVRLATRGDLTTFLMDLTAEIGADAYMLVAIVHDQDQNTARILASNWIHDAIELVGHRLIANLAQAPATAPGARPRSLLASEAPELPGVLDGEAAALLDVLGHREIYPLRVQAGRQRYFILFSAGARRGSTRARSRARRCVVATRSPRYRRCSDRPSPRTRCRIASANA